MKSSASTLGDFVSLQRGTTCKCRLLAPGPLLLGLAAIERDDAFRTDSIGSSAEVLLYAASAPTSGSWQASMVDDPP